MTPNIDHKGATWQEIAQKVRDHRDITVEKIEPAIPTQFDYLPSRVIDVPRQHLSAAEVEITESPIDSLLSSLAIGKLTSLEVTKAFLRRAAIAQKLTNCVYELLPERAIARAKELDEALAKGEPVGPLHGLPISVKEHIGVEGRDCTAGFVGWVGNKSPYDANILKILLKAGAVLYVRTTEPQGLMVLETCSNITGVTTNPHNTSLTPGGSSGGEGALLALRGSPLGIGSDIGGSIRSPAGNCGIYGLRPTPARLPLIGLEAFSIGCETVMGAIGPMSPTLDGIELFMKTVLNSRPWDDDLSLHQMPWRVLEPSKKLTVGVIWDDGVVKPSPPVQRALKEVVEKLKALPDVDVIDWAPYKHDEAMKLLTKLYAPDGGRAFAKGLATSGEPWLPLPEFTMKGSPGVEDLEQHDIWKYTKDREIFRYMYLQEWNNAAPTMDVILSPVGPLPAPPHGTSKYWGYTSIWNLLDYPGIVFPVTKVNPELDAKDESYKPRNEMDKLYYDNYSVDGQKDAPVALQLVAKKLYDEELVEALKTIKREISLPFVNSLA
ncbi:glutamyl-tRNA amidotransferase subunit A [Amylocarpus encephaloides]|uniref:amidase n=1 Tax=Amylocarpus encephaloides TaxID=45428 RepID=A0A9P7YKL6_9HELO|nr:glutamyl-tRNA amidotransferase subunit A [Amylocarpus encephaloides]